MNDEQMQPLLEVWLRDREIPRPKVQSGVARVMANVPRTRQQGRWLPFPALRRKTQTATATDTTEYRPSPIPATNGHAPTVIGRTNTMFSPVKAITVGALVFAIGGVLLIAQPFDQQGSIPGVEQGAEPPAPVEVTGELIDATCDEDGHICEVDIEWSDPRLEGTETYLTNSGGIDLSDDNGVGFDHRTHIIVTDDGAWRMRPQMRMDAWDYAGAEGWPDGDGSPWWGVLDGEGAYEDLSAVLIYPSLIPSPNFGPPQVINGFIVPSDMLPPAPEGASTK
jgi:hypothetical protein